MKKLEPDYEKSRHHKYYEEHKDQIKARVKEYDKTHKRDSKSKKLKHNFGITLEQYNDMLVSQNGVCAICKQVETHKHKSGVLCKLSVDHCHTTGRNRKLLCHKCNLGLGIFNDNPVVLHDAARYLEECNYGN